MSTDKHPEPKSVSIIRERLRKSGSILVFKVKNNITYNVLDSVVKYLPETKGNYEIEDFGFEYNTIAIKNVDTGLLLWIKKDNLILIEEGKKSMYVNDYYTDASLIDYRNYINGFRQTYKVCDDIIIEFTTTSDDYSFKIESSGETVLKCHNKDKLDEAYKHLMSKLNDMNHTKINDEMGFNYSPPTNFETGTVMYTRNTLFTGDVDFKNKDIINAILQMKVDKESTYSCFPPGSNDNYNVRLAISKNDGKRVECVFQDNKIIKEYVFSGSSLDTYYYKTIMRGVKTPYVITNVICGKSKEYLFDSEHKLYSISLMTPVRYVITVIKANEFTIDFVKYADENGEINTNVDIEDIEVVLDKLPPQDYGFVFEYLV